MRGKYLHPIDRKKLILAREDSRKCGPVATGSPGSSSSPFPHSSRQYSQSDSNRADSPNRYEITRLLARLLKSRESLSPTGEFDPSLPPATGGGRSRAASQNLVVKVLKGLWARWRGVRGAALARLERMLERTNDERVRYMQGIGWAVVGGSLAGGCLVFTKAV